MYKQINLAPIQYMLPKNIIEHKKALWWFTLDRSYFFLYFSHNSHFDWDN